MANRRGPKDGMALTTKASKPAPKRDPLGRPLTGRQRQIMMRLAHGVAYEELAVELGISVDTIKSHMKKIFIRLGAKNGCHAVALAASSHQIPLPPPPPQSQTLIQIPAQRKNGTEAQ
jgi:DNA-binding CsgD family transcriptional regulator